MYARAPPTAARTLLWKCASKNFLDS